MQKIIYIAGTRRTGSTILDILLGSSPDTCSVGQLADLHKSDSCSCGASLPECPLWGDVLSDPDLPVSAELKRLGQLTRKEIGLPLFLASPSLCRRYAEAYDRVYDAVFREVSVDTLIDSSKNMTRAFALLRSGRHDIRILHVLRDPRGFIGSLERRAERRGKRQPFTLAVMAEWLLKQSTGSSLLARATEQYMTVRYEDLMIDPFSMLDRIGEFAEIDVFPVKEKIRRGESFSSGHIFSGNQVSRMKDIVFDPDRIKTNRMNSKSNDLYWYTLGWPSSFWGYDREQSYLDQ